MTAVPQETALAKKRHLGFQTKFLLVLAAILVLFSGITALTIYRHELANLEENALVKTELIMKAIESNRDYVREILRPKMYQELGTNRFVLEAMSSSYISRMVMERFNKKAQGFVYRRVAIDAKNPAYEANDLEREMIQRFREDRSLTEWQGIIESESRQYFMRFQPVKFEKSCLSCHGRPEEAPSEVTDLYGTTRGYHRQEGDISGVVSVGMPVDLSLDKIKNFSLALFLGVVPSILIVYVIISAVFNRFIATNLRNILSFFRENIKDEKGRDLFAHTQDLDEIEELTATARAIAGHLSQNQNTLEKYAAEVSRSKELLQSVFDGISDPVVLVDHEGRIKAVNEAFRRRYGVSLQQVVGLRPSAFLAREICPLAACEEFFSSGLDQPASHMVQMATGEIFLIYFYPVRGKDGEAGDMVCYVKDITEQKRIESNIQHTEKIASIGQLAAGIAHEINNPLGVILCHIDLIKGDGQLTPETRGDLEIIEKHAGNCRTIISDLLKFAHQPLDVKKRVCLNEIIDEVVTMVGSQSRKQQITIGLDLAESLPPVTVDPDKIKQVLLNMLLNSLQAVEREGEIRVGSRFDAAEGQIRITIEDNGPGIPPDIKDRIFDPFFTTKPPGKGTGLGLSVSYGIIRDHRGTITVDSTPGKYTRFVITLPVPENQDE